MGECWEENKAIYCSNAVLEAAQGLWEPSSLSQPLTRWPLCDWNHVSFVRGGKTTCLHLT